MKPSNMSWGQYASKHYELAPLASAAGFGLAIMVLSIMWQMSASDLQIKRHRLFPWDRRDLLRRPYCRKLHTYQKYDGRTRELHQIYKEMEKVEKDMIKEEQNRKKKIQQC